MKKYDFSGAHDPVFEGLLTSHGAAISRWSSGSGSREEAKAARDAVRAHFYRRAVEPTPLQPTPPGGHPPAYCAAEKSAEPTSDDVLPVFWREVIRAYEQMGIVSDRVGLEVVIGAPVIEAARRALKLRVPHGKLCHDGHEPITFYGEECPICLDERLSALMPEEPVHSEEWLRQHRCPPDVPCPHCNPEKSAGLHPATNICQGCREPMSKCRCAQILASCRHSRTSGMSDAMSDTSGITCLDCGDVTCVICGKFANQHTPQEQIECDAAL